VGKKFGHDHLRSIRMQRGGHFAREEELGPLDRLHEWLDYV
jgi:hypothetical protein